MFPSTPPRAAATTRFAAGLVLLPFFALTGCLADGGGEGPAVPADYQYDTVLATVGTEVIYATYSDLADKGAALHAAVKALDANPTQGTLMAARQAWRDARAPWERSEGFLFGPVSDKGIDPSIDSWPLDSITLKGILTGSNDTIDLDFITRQADEVKGFHALEYLLFGVDSSKVAASLTLRERQYMMAAAANFKARVDTLKASWNPAEGNFLGTFKNAGNGNATYASQRSAAEELLDGMIAICDEVANGKITDPYNDGISKEESRFSRNSTVDFANNIRSVRNVYLGVYAGSAGKGVKTWVQAADSALAGRVEVEIDSAISKINQMGEFATALSSARPKVAAARTAIQTLKATLEGKVKPAVLP